MSPYLQNLSVAAEYIVICGATVLTAVALILMLLHLITAQTGLDPQSGTRSAISKGASGWLALGHAGALFVLLMFWSRQLK
jgi:hypothetical protein